MQRAKGLPPHELFKVRVWLGLQGIKFDPDQPRDEDGKWTSGGGASAGGDSGASAVQLDPLAQVSGPVARVGERSGKTASGQAIAKVKAAAAAIPPAHAEALKHVPINVVYGHDDLSVGGASGLYSRANKEIFVAEHAKFVTKVWAPGNNEMTESSTYVPLDSIERTAVHELGHAYDHHIKQQGSFQLMARQDNGRSPSVIDQGVKRLKRKEKSNAKYYLSTPTETFAELYALAYSPNRNIKYFGGMTAQRAEEVFSEALTKIRSFADRTKKFRAGRRAVEFDATMTERLIENGWFVNTDGLVYAIINGSAYEINASGTPLAKLPPGDYTDEEAQEALKQKQSADIIRHQRWELTRARALRLLEKFDPDQPRDEGGKWTSGGGSAGGSGDAKPTGGGRGSSAGELLKPTSASVESIVAKVSGAAARIREVKAKLESGVPTDAPVDKGGHKQADGSWTPERAAAHDRILNSMFTPEKVAAATPAPGEKPTLHLLGGRGGSGKSWFTGPQGSVNASKAVMLNNDDFKEALPGYEGWNAALLHEESRHIGKIAERTARERGLNIVIDGTMRRTGDFEKKVNEYKAAGYRIEGHYMYLAPEVSTERAITRFMKGGKTGRYVPPEYTLGSRSNEASFDAVKGKMDRWEIYDNSGTAPKLHARSK